MDIGREMQCFCRWFHCCRRARGQKLWFAHFSTARRLLFTNARNRISFPFMSILWEWMSSFSPFFRQLIWEMWYECYSAWAMRKNARILCNGHLLIWCEPHLQTFVIYILISGKTETISGAVKMIITFCRVRKRERVHTQCCSSNWLICWFASDKRGTRNRLFWLISLILARRLLVVYQLSESAWTHTICIG